MKKSKLVLRSVTVRTLSTAHLAEIAGGAASRLCPNTRQEGCDNSSGCVSVVCPSGTCPSAFCPIP